MTVTATATGKTIKLKEPREFWHGNTRRVLPAGTEVGYRRDETDTHVVHVATWTDDENTRWVSRVRVAKPAARPACDFCGAGPCACATHGRKAAPAPPAVKAAPAPAVQPGEQTRAAVAVTAREAAVGVGAVVERQTFGPTQQEVRVRALDRAARVLAGPIYQVNYYIPTALGDLVENPSRIFRRHGFRLDGSNWVFPAAGLESDDVRAVFREWDAMQPAEEPSGLDGFRVRTAVRYWVIQYTPEQVVQMRQLALAQLADELVKTHRSLIQRIDGAAERIKAAREAVDTTEKDRDKAENAYNGSLRATIQEACDRFAMCLKGAEIFDETGSLDALFGAVRDAVQARALAADAELKARGVKGVSADLG